MLDPRRYLTAALTLCVLVAAPAMSQDSTAARALGRAAYAALFRLEQEPSYAAFPGLVFGMPRETHNGEPLRILYEAQIAPPFFLFAGRKPLLVAVTPKIVVRQYGGGSYPVPPPSYMPRITAYWWGRPFSTPTTIDSAVYAFVRLGHHSNGQEGRFYDTTATPQRVNYESGDFYTNYLEVGFVRRLVRLGPIVGTQQWGFEWHPEGWIAKAMRPIYGRYRMHLNSRFSFPRAILGVVDGGQYSLGYIAGSLAPDRRDIRSRLALSATLHSNIADIGDFQPFVSYYTGQDYYNIRFDRNISTVRIGVMTPRQSP